MYIHTGNRVYIKPRNIIGVIFDFIPTREGVQYEVRYPSKVNGFCIESFWEDELVNLGGYEKTRPTWEK